MRLILNEDGERVEADARALVTQTHLVAVVLAKDLLLLCRKVGVRFFHLVCEESDAQLALDSDHFSLDSQSLPSQFGVGELSRVDATDGLVFV